MPWLNSRICFDTELEISKMPKDSQGLLGKETACGSQEEKGRAPLMLLESTEILHVHLFFDKTNSVLLSIS